MTTSGTVDELTIRTAPVPALAVLVPVGLWILVARLVGTSSPLVDDLSLGGPPLIGHWNLVVPGSAVVAGAIATAMCAWLPAAAQQLQWRVLLPAGWAVSAVFATALAAIDGRDAVSEPLGGQFEYRAVLTDIDRLGVGEFVRDFTTDLPAYPTHVRGHPVGAPLVFWAQEQLGLTGVEWSAALVILVGTSVVVSVMIATRAVAGEAIARRALPFLVAFPGLVWVATSVDAFFAGVVAASIACFAVAAGDVGVGVGVRSDVAALAGGILGACALHLSYGTAVMLLPVLVIVVGHRRVRPLVVGAVGAAAVTAVFVAAGFWWFDGLDATRAEYVKGAGGVRPYGYFATLGNPAAFLFALGPAVPVALARLRDRRLWLLAGGALVGVVLADISGLSKAEVERIWLPFVPWLALAGAGFPLRSARWWFTAQVAATVILQLSLESPW